MQGQGAIDLSKLGALVRSYRESRDIPLREAAKEVGLSPSTLSRVERGSAVPDLGTVERLMAWVGQPVASVVTVPPPRASRHPRGSSDTPAQSADTLATLEIQLRADPNLENDDAKALLDMFKSAYLHLVKRHRSGAKEDR